MVARQNTPNPAAEESLSGDESQLAPPILERSMVQAALANNGKPVAFGLPLPPLRMPDGGLLPLIQKVFQKEKGPYVQEYPEQAAKLDQLLTAGGRPRGNTEQLSIGKDEAGNKFALARTSGGVEISVQTNQGASYTLELAGSGAIKSATYVGPDGKTQPPSEATVNKMIGTALVQGQKATTAPELPSKPPEGDKPQSTAPEL